MTFNEYQEAAKSTASYPEFNTSSISAIAYCALGLGEAGEIQNKIKKVMRGDVSWQSLFRDDSIVQELGDLLWYISALANELDVKLDDIATKNLAKLADRKSRNVIKGSGDNR